MGVAAYNRGSAAISRQINAEARAVEFEVMEQLSALPKFDDAGTPFADIRFVPGHGGIWAECPTTGYGFWYPTLREAVRRWRVEIYACDHGIFTARPMPCESIGIEPATPIKVLSHYCNDSSSADWLAAMREIETEGEITPAQTDPHPAVMDASTPVLLRRQAA